MVEPTQREIAVRILGGHFHPLAEEALGLVEHDHIGDLPILGRASAPGPEVEFDELPKPLERVLLELVGLLCASAAVQLQQKRTQPGLVPVHGGFARFSVTRLTRFARISQRR